MSISKASRTAAASSWEISPRFCFKSWASLLEPDPLGLHTCHRNAGSRSEELPGRRIGVASRTPQTQWSSYAASIYIYILIYNYMNTECKCKYLNFCHHDTSEIVANGWKQTPRHHKSQREQEEEQKRERQQQQQSRTTTTKTTTMLTQLQSSSPEDSWILSVL